MSIYNCLHTTQQQVVGLYDKSVTLLYWWVANYAYILFFLLFTIISILFPQHNLHTFAKMSKMNKATFLLASNVGINKETKNPTTMKQVSEATELESRANTDTNLWARSKTLLHTRGYEG